MRTYKLTKNLWLHEYIPEKLYKQYCERKPHYLVGLIDKRLVIVDQFMRDRFGPVIINSWKDYNDVVDEDDRNWSGIRTPNSPYYSFTSQHSWGRASDKIFLKVIAEEVRTDIIENYDKLYKPLGLTTIEDNVSWVHSDVRMLIKPGKLYIVYP